MKLSDLIKILEEAKLERGDLEIRLYDEDRNGKCYFRTPFEMSSSMEFFSSKLGFYFSDENDICMDGREFLYFNSN